MSAGITKIICGVIRPDAGVQCRRQFCQIPLVSKYHRSAKRRCSENLPVHLFETMGQIQAKIPTEVLVTDRREFELAEEGFITLTMRKDSDNAAFFSANSVQKPKHFPGKDAETTISWVRSFLISSSSIG